MKKQILSLVTIGLLSSSMMIGHNNEAYASSKNVYNS